MEEMLFAMRIETDTKGPSIFEEVKSYLSENNIPMENIIACATDGATSVVDRYRGFIAHLKRIIPSIFTIHCVIHREHLVAKNLGGHLNLSFSVVIKAVNFIKSHALQDRLFRQLCEENDEDFQTLLLHTEVRWLSKGNCLQRFVTLWDTKVSFMSDKEHGERLVDAKADIFYLADIFQKLNLLNKTLQGKNSNLVDCKEAIVSFLKNLEVYCHNMGRQEFLQFPNLKMIAEALKDDDLTVYVKRLKQIHKDMQERFNDLLNLGIPDWILNPFEVQLTQVEAEIQESLIDLQSDITARHQFSQFQKDFWIKSDLPNKFTTLWEKAQSFFIAFPSTYLVDSGFCKVVFWTKSRNRIDIATRGDLRLSLSNLEPDIMKLAEKHQPQGSH
ncbi:zinc finger BED domain-containing protein 5-like [Mobula birostris]|uniref:zinc finger BED domain-containing protein 5-like n=1 Tax=Mobula birostris TaxID=1983395 RepID=UPI003B27CEAC